MVTALATSSWIALLLLVAVATPARSFSHAPSAIRAHAAGLHTSLPQRLTAAECRSGSSTCICAFKRRIRNSWYRKLTTAATATTGITTTEQRNGFQNNKDIQVLVKNKFAVVVSLYLLYILVSAAIRNKAMVLIALDWRYFFVGCLCSAYSHGITCPIDVIKTMIQTYPEKFSGRSSVAAAKEIIRDHGPFFLLQGLWPTIVGYGFEGSVKFGTYEFLKAFLANYSPHKMVNYMIASIVAGVLASLVLCPMEEVRIKMVGDESWAGEGFVSGCGRLLREHGVFGTFSGMQAMLSKQVPYTVMKQAAFDIIAGALYSVAIVCGVRALDIKWFISFAAAFLTSIVSCVASMPGDVILTQTYAFYNYQCLVDGEADCSYTNNFNAIVRKINTERGIMGFFVGFQTRLVHVVSIVTSQLVFYDVIKIAVGLKTTGSH